MTTNYPSSKSTSAKNASSSLSARKVSDIESWEVQRFIWDNHAPFYKGHVPTLLFSMTLAGLFYNKKRGSAFPSMKHIAEKTGWSLRQVSRHVDIMLKAVDENGQPLWEVRSGFNIGGNSKNNEYIPLFRKKILEGKPPKVAEELPFLMVDADRDAEEGAFPDNNLDVDEAADAVDETVSAADQGFGDDDDDTTILESALDETDAEHNVQDSSVTVIPASYCQSETEMWNYVQELRRNRQRVKHNPPPAFSSDAFLTLAKNERDFLAALTQYCGERSSLVQGELNTVGDWVVRAWLENQDAGMKDFYAAFITDYAENAAYRIQAMS